MDLIKNELNNLLTLSIHNDNILRNQYKRSFKVNLIKKRCQHLVWHLLHNLSVFYPENPSDEQKNNIKDHLIKIKKYMPFCNTCSNNGADNFIESSDLNNIVSNKDNLINFIIDYHKFINVKFTSYNNQDDTNYTIDYVKNKYSNGLYNEFFLKQYNIDIIQLFETNSSFLKFCMDNLQEKVAKEINNMNYDLYFTVIINE